MFYLGKLEPIFGLFAFLFFFNFKYIQIVAALISSFLTAFHNSKAEKENETKQNTVVEKGEREREIWKPNLEKYNHKMETSNFSTYMFEESEVYLVFPCPKNKHELSWTDTVPFLLCNIQLVIFVA